MMFREYNGLPWGFPGQPAPAPVKTRTHSHRQGFLRARGMGLVKPKGRKTRRGQHCGFVISDLPGPAQSREPGQAEPVSAGPGQAIGDGPAMALAGLRISESQSRRPRPRLCTKFVSPYFWSFFSFFFFFLM